VAKINDDLAITINIKWLVQIVVLVAIIVGSYYQAQKRMADNQRHIQIIEQDLSDLKNRISTIEAKRTQRLEDENKSLIEKVNIFKKR
tara:strand:- start:10880 stop:11143 length:264 start_codon:yes stop_codon:yes gene_type:complete